MKIKLVFSFNRKMVRIIIKLFENSRDNHEILASFLKTFGIILEDFNEMLSYKIASINDKSELHYTDEDEKLIQEISQHYLVETVLKDCIIAKLQ